MVKMTISGTSARQLADKLHTSTDGTCPQSIPMVDSARGSFRRDSSVGTLTQGSKSMDGSYTADPLTADVEARTPLLEIESRLLWLATSIVHHANRVRPNVSGLKVGG